MRRRALQEGVEAFSIVKIKRLGFLKLYGVGKLVMNIGL